MARNSHRPSSREELGLGMSGSRPLSVRVLTIVALWVAGASLTTAYALYVLSPYCRSVVPFISELDFYGPSRIPFTSGLFAESVLLLAIAHTVARTRAEHLKRPLGRFVNWTGQVVLDGAAVGLMIAALVNVPTNAIWHGLAAAVGFRGLLVWGWIQIGLGWGSLQSRHGARTALLTRTAVTLFGAIMLRVTLAFAVAGQDAIHGGNDWMAFYSALPRPVAFEWAAVAEWVLAVACFGILATLPAELSRHAGMDHRPSSASRTA